MKKSEARELHIFALQKLGRNYIETYQIFQTGEIILLRTIFRQITFSHFLFILQTVKDVNLKQQQ